MSREFKDNAQKANDGCQMIPIFNLNDNSNETINLRGMFELNRFKGPAIDSHYFDTPVKDDNLVVTMARKIMSRLLSGASLTPSIATIGGPVVVTNPNQLYVTRMKWGTAGHNPGNPTEALTPTVSDEDLASPIVSPAFKAVVVDYPTDTSVRFTAELDQTEANGLGLSEEGLFTSVNFMFARKTFGLLTKTSDFTFQFRHTILF